jgi:hypothetical protein
MADDLRTRLHTALTREHYRRSRERIEASPEEHCAAFTDVVLAELARHDARCPTTPKEPPR